MALQLRMLVLPSCLHRSFCNPSKLPSAMLQHRLVPNFPCNCVQYSSVNNGARFGNSAQFKFSKGIMISPCLPLRSGNLYPRRCGGSLLSGISETEYGFRLNSSAHKIIQTRLFCSKNKKKFLLRVKSGEGGSNAYLVDRKIGDGKSKGKMPTVTEQRQIPANCPDPFHVGASKSGVSVNGATIASKSQKQIQTTNKSKGAGETEANTLAKKDQKAGGAKGDKDLSERSASAASKANSSKTTRKKSSSPASHIAKTSFQSESQVSKPVKEQSQIAITSPEPAGGVKKGMDLSEINASAAAEPKTLINTRRKSSSPVRNIAKASSQSSSLDGAKNVKSQLSMSVKGQKPITTPTSPDPSCEGALKSSKSIDGATSSSKSKKQIQDAKKKKAAVKSKAVILEKKPQKAGSVKAERNLSERSVSSAASESKNLNNTRKKSSSLVGHIAKTSIHSSSIICVKTGVSQLRPLYPPSGRSVMVVESSTKAKTIQNYLGAMFEVIPSYGHVRDLAAKSRSVRPDDDFSMVWEVPAAAWTHLKSIKVALSGAENLILASDPDREGEAIAWHIMEMLQQQDALNKNINVARVVFHEITESSIRNALQKPRDIDANLVNAYLARRALDYLIGFGISPILWKKLPSCRSAGRVQSAALALICDKESEVEDFKPQEYWTVRVNFHDACLHSSMDRPSISSQLTHFSYKKLSRFSICSHAEAEDIEKKVHSSKFEVQGIKKSRVHKNPPMPYITSTLQQDSTNKLHFTSTATMMLAQKLYEGIKLSDKEATGLITYMRTDGVHISNEAANDIWSLVKDRYGEEFASKSIRKYITKVKNAQEAHEAIRPTNIWRLPSSLVGILDDDSLKLYTLIWTRTVACQMEPSATDMIQVDICNMEGDMILRSTESQVGFRGYLAAYQDREAGVNGNDENENDAGVTAYDVLSELKVKDTLYFDKVDIQHHHTKPPARYTEGALVKKMEELGIGRPSTYASTMKVLQDRNYATLKDRVLHPDFRGRMVCEFLSHHFSEIADYSFTAEMENELDNVSAGTTEWKVLLHDYWERFNKYCDLASKVDKRQVEKTLENKFHHFLFDTLPNSSRVCPSCLVGTLIFKVNNLGDGYFIGCDQHPRCKFISRKVLEPPDDVGPKTPESFTPRLIGNNPASNEKVLLKKGPYGFYVQLGDDWTGSAPKRAPLSEVKDIDALTLDYALELLKYPITLGTHPDDNVPVLLTHSKQGFSIKHRRTIAPVPKNLDPKKMTLEAALKLLKSSKVKQSGRPKGNSTHKEALL